MPAVGNDRQRLWDPRSYEFVDTLDTLAACHPDGPHMRILHILGALFIVAWLLLWLGLKIAFAAVHLLVVVGVLLIIGGLIAGRGASARS